jgi:hypothetical protein
MTPAPAVPVRPNRHYPSLDVSDDLVQDALAASKVQLWAATHDFPNVANSFGTVAVALRAAWFAREEGMQS